MGAFDVQIAEHWARGGKGALEIAGAVKRACQSTKEVNNFKFLYGLDLTIEDKLRAVA